MFSHLRTSRFFLPIYFCIILWFNFLRPGHASRNIDICPIVNLQTALSFNIVSEGAIWHFGIWGLNSLKKNKATLQPQLFIFCICFCWSKIFLRSDGYRRTIISLCCVCTCRLSCCSCCLCCDSILYPKVHSFYTTGLWLSSQGGSGA